LRPWAEVVRPVDHQVFKLSLNRRLASIIHEYELHLVGQVHLLEVQDLPPHDFVAIENGNNN
jgi:hypothetical protein